MTARLFSSALCLLAAVLAAPAAGEESTVTRYVDSESDRMPLQTVVPQYPHAARRDRVEGQVQVCYPVARKGRPYRVAVRQSTHRIFERPAMRAVKASRYRPLEPGEKAAAIKTCRTFRFELAAAVAENSP